MDCIHVAQERSQWWDSVKTVMNSKIPHTALSNRCIIRSVCEVRMT